MKSVIESSVMLSKKQENTEPEVEEVNEETCSSSSEYEEVEVEVTDSDQSSSDEELSKNNSNNSKHVETSLASIRKVS